MPTLRVVVNNRSGFSPAQAEKHNEACRLTQEVINTVEFRMMVISRVYTSTNKSGLEIYQHIMTGSEVLTPEIDNEIDVDVELYEKNNSTVGYTYGNTIKTWLNNKFFKTFDHGGVAGNLVHEWLHKLGYDHSSANDLDSVPYAVGFIVRDLVRDLMGGRVMTRIDAATQTDFDPPVVIAPSNKVCRRTWKTLFLTKVCWYE